MLVRQENSNIKDKGYFCANSNTKDTIAERIFSQIENEIMDDITSALGDRITEYSEEIHSHMSQLKELIKNDIASAYETAYTSFCSTNRSYEESDADGGKYYVISENIRVEDPLGRVLENKSNQIAKNTETHH